MSENYGAFQTEIYGKGTLLGQWPNVTTDPRRLEDQAREKLGSRSYNYVAGGAGEKATMDSNRLAFRQWKMYALLVPIFGER
ncbi:Dehydrogenase [Aspergillus sp. HF37]|nr:Dehydrogenase [Aspergillus sp. HF37]